MIEHEGVQIILHHQLEQAEIALEKILQSIAEELFKTSFFYRLALVRFSHGATQTGWNSTSFVSSLESMIKMLLDVLRVGIYDSKVFPGPLYIGRHNRCAC